MSIVEQIAHLEALADIDQEIRSLTEQIEKEKAEVGGAKAELADLVDRLAADRESVDEMDRTRQDLVQELRQMDKQIERSRERLGRARNEREVNAAERELDELRKLQRDRDEEIKKVVAIAEQARASIEESNSRQQEIEDQLKGSMEGVTRTLADLGEKLEQQQRARGEVLAKLPKPLMRRYESLRTRRPNPVARTVDGVCQGCHIELPPMQFHEMLSQTRFEQCPNCHRIIYYSPPPEDGAGDGSGAADA
ncbi:MAG: hypothetical protein JRI23_24915 [Deltaproteobacteria bacterium]|nr:hypothetical protein [Deltaproteobacteria bacterium]MBW2535258.1 hypothetical protein [Deltaproteobacteria bacterium]